MSDNTGQISLTFPDGNTRAFPRGITAAEVASAIAPSLGKAAISASLEPVRHAFKSSRPAEKPHAHSKYWQELLGQTGGPVRAPLLELTDTEKRAIRAAFEASGIANV